MQIMKLNVKDGKGEIEVVVSEVIAESRMNEFFQWAFAAGDERDDLRDQINKEQDIAKKMRELGEAICPFCSERGFDLIGLKNHLQSGHCEIYDGTPEVSR